METTGFVREVAEQPAALLALAEFYGSREGLSLLRKWAGLAHRKRRVVFSGMGTSEFVPDAVRTALAREGVDASTADAGEWLHYPGPFSGFAVLISQSGESAETRRLAPRIARQGALVAVTNDAASSLARAACLVLPLHAGHERSISTKTYTNTLALLHLMAQALSGGKAVERGLCALRRVATTMPKVNKACIRKAAASLAEASAVSFVSRGPAMAAARQAALTFMEGTRLPTAAFTGGGFRHGPFEMIERGFRSVFMIPRGATAKLLTAMAGEVLDKGGQAVVVTDAGTYLSGRGCVVLRIPCHGEALFSLSAAVTQELLLDATARRRGLTTGQFRYGGKITDRE